MMNNSLRKSSVGLICSTSCLIFNPCTCGFVCAPLNVRVQTVQRRQEALTNVTLCKSELSGHAHSVYTAPPGCYAVLSMSVITVGKKASVSHEVFFFIPPLLILCFWDAGVQTYQLSFLPKADKTACV